MFLIALTGADSIQNLRSLQIDSAKCRPLKAAGRTTKIVSSSLQNKRITLIIFAHTGRQSARNHRHKSQGWISFYDFKMDIKV